MVLGFRVLGGFAFQYPWAWFSEVPIFQRIAARVSGCFGTRFRVEGWFGTRERGFQRCRSSRGLLLLKRVGGAARGTTPHTPSPGERERVCERERECVCERESVRVSVRVCVKPLRYRDPPVLFRRWAWSLGFKSRGCRGISLTKRPMVTL